MPKRSLRKPKPTEKAAQAAALKARTKLLAIRRKSSSSPSKSSSQGKKRLPTIKREEKEVETINISSDDNEDDKDDNSLKSDAMADSDDPNQDGEDTDEHIPSQSSKEDLDTYEASFIDDEDMSGEEDTADDSPSPTRGKGKILVKDSDVEEIPTPAVIKAKSIGKQSAKKTPAPTWTKSSGTVKRSLPQIEESNVDTTRTSSNKKKKTTEVAENTNVFNAEDLQLDDLLDALYKKAQQKSVGNDPRVQRILKASLGTSKPTSSAMPQADSDSDTKVSSSAIMRTPTKKGKKKALTVNKTPRTALAETLESLVMDGQSSIEEYLEPDISLYFDDLVPLPFLSDNVQENVVVSWTESVLDYYPKLTPAHREKLTTFVLTPSFGPDDEIHNLATEDPRKFCVIAEPGPLSNTTVHCMKELLPEATSDDILYKDCAFVSFGQITNSGIKSPGRLGSSQLYNRSVYLAEIRHLWDRKYSAAYNIMAKYYESDSQYSRPQMDELGMRVFYHGVQYASAIEPIPGSSSNLNLPPGASLQMGKSKYVPANRETWYEDYLKPAMRRATISTHNQRVPVFDATHIFQGSDVAHHWDFEKLATICDIHEGEVPNRSLVAVLHSVHRTYVKAGNRMMLQFGIYAIIILCKATHQEEGKGW